MGRRGQLEVRGLTWRPYGRRDPVIPVVNAHVMGALIPRGTVHLHEGGHLGLLTRPDELGRVVEEFLDA